jgi:prophage regulatory protein
MFSSKQLEPEYRARRIVRIAEVMRRTGLRKSRIYTGIAAGEFPKPVAITPRSVGWVESEIDEWIAERIALRDSGFRSKCAAAVQKIATGKCLNWKSGTDGGTSD